MPQLQHLNRKSSPQTHTHLRCLPKAIQAQMPIRPNLHSTAAMSWQTPPQSHHPQPACTIDCHTKGLKSFASKILSCCLRITSMAQRACNSKGPSLPRQSLQRQFGRADCNSARKRCFGVSAIAVDKEQLVAHYKIQQQRWWEASLLSCFDFSMTTFRLPGAQGPTPNSNACAGSCRTFSNRATAAIARMRLPSAPPPPFQFGQAYSSFPVAMGSLCGTSMNQHLLDHTHYSAPSTAEGYAMVPPPPLPRFNPTILGRCRDAMTGSSWDELGDVCHQDWTQAIGTTCANMR